MVFFMFVQIKNRLFQGQHSFGMDLIALNIQRGRDVSNSTLMSSSSCKVNFHVSHHQHGLPPYNDYRELCGKSRAKSWEDLLDSIELRVIVNTNFVCLIGT